MKHEKGRPNPVGFGALWASDSSGSEYWQGGAGLKLALPIRALRRYAATMTPPSFLQSSLLVALGGGAGSWLRYMVGRLTIATVGPVRASAFPWATLAVNVAGSFAMGLLAGWLARHGSSTGILGGEAWRLLLGVGLLGGFTTFSAFSLEFALFVERGALAQGALYVGLSLIAAFAGLFAGLIIMRTHI